MVYVSGIEIIGSVVCAMLFAEMAVLFSKLDKVAVRYRDRMDAADEAREGREGGSLGKSGQEEIDAAFCGRRKLGEPLDLVLEELIVCGGRERIILIALAQCRLVAVGGLRLGGYLGRGAEEGLPHDA